MTTLPQFQLGAATVTIINVCDLSMNLATAFTIDAATVEARYAPFFAQTLHVPVLCIHIQLPTTTVLVDAGLNESDIPNYQPPPHLLDQMAAAGLDPAAVEHIIITHVHGDHFNALTVDGDGGYRLAFPNAKVYLGRADWEKADVQQDRHDPSSLISRTLEILWQQGRLVLPDGDLELGPGLRIIHAPGETPGHQLLRVESAGKVLYCVGDLYHHPVEVEQPAWSVSWSDVAANLVSRQQLAARALTENALLIATHIAGVGHLTGSAEEVTWVEG